MTVRAILCRCGHEADSHHQKQWACLAMLCECNGFENPATTKATPKRPSHPAFCRCYGCRQALGE